jgi:hypothetical protein
MAWTAPMTAVAGNVFTAAQFNTHVRDNLLETAPAKATAANRLFVSTGANAIAEREFLESVVNTAETTASTSYTDLATFGPSISIVTGTAALVWLTAEVENNTGGVYTAASPDIQGATTTAASDDVAVASENDAGHLVRAGTCTRFTLNAGTHTITAKYRVVSNTGTFRRRRLQVLSL